MNRGLSGFSTAGAYSGRWEPIIPAGTRMPTSSGSLLLPFGDTYWSSVRLFVVDLGGAGTLSSVALSTANGEDLYAASTLQADGLTALQGSTYAVRADVTIFSEDVWDFTVKPMVASGAFYIDVLDSTYNTERIVRSSRFGPTDSNVRSYGRPGMLKVTISSNQTNLKVGMFGKR